MKCLILAGGFATRLYPLTINKAKALIEYRGKPVISHIIEKIPQDMDILVATNIKFEQDFHAWLKTIDRRVNLCIEEAATNGEKMGAVGAIDYWIKTKRIGEDLMVIAADNYFELDMTDFIARFNKSNPLIAVYDVGSKEKACDIGKTCQVGLVILKGDRVTRLDEKPLKATSKYISTGIYIFPGRIFNILSAYATEKKRDNLGNFISYLITENEIVHAYTFYDTWLDIGDEINRGRIVI